MRYDQFAYLWPPRPEQAVQRVLLRDYQQRGWIAQAKLNGTCNIIAVSPERQIVAMNRHNAPHKAWTPSRGSAAAFQALPGRGWYVFVAELMHAKVPGVRDTNYVNDLLVADGEHLVGETFRSRQNRLKALFLKAGEAETLSHIVLDAHTWLAKNFAAGFTALFDQLDQPIHEGLVLKDPEARLAPCLRASANVNWQVKIRRPTKNFAF